MDTMNKKAWWAKRSNTLPFVKADMAYMCLYNFPGNKLVWEIGFAPKDCCKIVKVIFNYMINCKYYLDQSLYCLGQTQCHRKLSTCSSSVAFGGV